jgi:class 3 adenylate cyclase
VRGGLALIETVGKLGRVEPLQVRIGIGTGEVVVGDVIGSGEARERGVVVRRRTWRRVCRPRRRQAPSPSKRPPAFC